MLETLDWFTVVGEGIAAVRLRAGAFAAQAYTVDQTGSTNDDVARLAGQGAVEGTTVIARGQTAGRGRRGASWHSPPGHGIYVSTLLRPAQWPSIRRDAGSPAASLITLMAGVAVADAVRDVSPAAVELKWPNDVMVRPSDRTGWRKLAGILAEGASEGVAVRSVVLGIGLNLRRSRTAPADVQARMISLEEAAGAPVSLASLVGALLVRLRAGRDILAEGDAGEVRARWLALAPAARGTPVRWQHGATRRGVTAGIDDNGSLLVRVDATVIAVHGGVLHWQRDARAVS